MEDKIIQKLEAHDRQFELVQEKFGGVDSRFDVITSKLVELDARCDTFVTKDDFFEFKDQVLQGQDQMIEILRRLDEERAFGSVRVDRLEEDVVKIKTHLKMA